MKDKLPRFLLPTADIKKAIDRNAKKDEDLSFFLHKLDKERKLALDQLTRRQDAFKKEMIKRRESQGNMEFKAQFIEHKNLMAKEDDSRLDVDRRSRRRKTVQGLRRALSFEESRASSKIELPSVINKRYSLPASPSAQDSSKEDELAFNNDQFEAFPTPNVATRSWTKSRDCKADSAIRRHSTSTAVTSMHVDDKSRLLRRRRSTLHNLMPSSVEKCVPEVEAVVSLPL